MDRIEVYKIFFDDDQKEYHSKQLQKFEKGKKYLFHIWPAIFGIIWFCYRKLYKEGIILLLAMSLLTVLFSIFISLLIPQNIYFQWYINAFSVILSFVGNGFLSNFLYFNKAQRIVVPFLQKYPNNETIPNSDLQVIYDKGGVSNLSVYICIFGLIILQLLMVAI